MADFALLARTGFAGAAIPGRYGRVVGGERTVVLTERSRLTIAQISARRDSAVVEIKDSGGVPAQVAHGGVDLSQRNLHLGEESTASNWQRQSQTVDRGLNATCVLGQRRLFCVWITQWPRRTINIYTRVLPT